MSLISKQDIVALLNTYGVDISSIVDNERSLRNLHELYVSYTTNAQEQGSEEDVRAAMIQDIEEEIDRQKGAGGGPGAQDEFEDATAFGVSNAQSEWAAHVQYPMRSVNCCRAGVIVKFSLSAGVSYYIRQCKRTVANESNLCTQHALCSPPLVRYADDGTVGSYLTGPGAQIPHSIVDRTPDEQTLGSIQDIFKHAHDAAKNAENRMKTVDYTLFLARIKKDKKRLEKRMRELAFIAVSDLTHKLDTLKCEPPPMEKMLAMFEDDADDQCGEDDEEEEA